MTLLMVVTGCSTVDHAVLSLHLAAVRLHFADMVQAIMRFRD